MNPIDKAWESCIPSPFPLPPLTQDVLYYPEAGLYVRDRGDIGIILEQTRDYSDIKHMTFPPDALLLDLGGHIGDSVWYFLRHHKKFARVVTVEADPRNAEMLHLNWGFDERVTIVDGAVVDDDKRRVSLYLGKTYSGDNSLEAYQGRTRVLVNAVSFDSLLEHRPTMIKCDIEGGEFSLDWTKIPDSVSTVFMEIHQNREGWIEKGRLLEQTFLDMGFSSLHTLRHAPLYHRRQIAVWKRGD